MPVSDVVFRSRRPYRVHAACTPDHAAVKRGALSRKAMLAGTSMLVMALVTSTASARPLGGAAFFSAPNLGSDAAQAASQQAAAIARQSQNALMRATQAIQAMQAVQSAARNLAVSGPNSLGAGLPAVTNGLSAGGLIPDSGLAAPGRSNPVSTTTWINASTPT